MSKFGNVSSGVVGTLLIALAGLVGGCGQEDGQISIRYDRPAKYHIPKTVRKIAIVQFGAKKGTEKKWGEIATDKLTSAMDEYNKKFHRYILVDRKRVSALMDERDFQMSIADTDQAVKLGRIANVDAMIYGSVYVAENIEVHKSSIPTPYGTIPVTTRRYQSTAAINFTMDDVHSTKTICSVTVMRKYDSKDKADQKKYKKYKNNMSAITTMMIQECVDEFIAKVSPHQIVVTVRLEKGKSKLTSQGNRFAREHEYADALDVYKGALRERPDDYGALFNMGLCYEALGKMDEAYQCYSKAVRLRPKAKFIRARRRVRMENGEKN